jgi:hypothetical protein
VGSELAGFAPHFLRSFPLVVTIAMAADEVFLEVFFFCLPPTCGDVAVSEVSTPAAASAAAFLL